MPVLLLAAFLALQGVEPAQPSAEELGRAYYLFLQGRTLEGADDVAGAIDSYRQAILLLPWSAEIRISLARLYVSQNQLAEARREAAAALAAEPDHRRAHRLLGAIQAASVQGLPPESREAAIAEAVAHLERALVGNESDPAAELTLSHLYLRQGEVAKAVARLRKVLVDRPDYPQAMRLLVGAYEAGGQTDEALRTRARLGQVEPDRIEALVRQIDRLENAGRWSEAASRWADIMRRDQGGVIYRTRQAVALLNVGRLAEARDVLAEATRELPRDVNGWYLLSLVEGRVGNAAAAEAAAARVEEIDPDDLRAPLAMARARQAAGDDRGVVAALGTRVTAPRPGDPTSSLYVQMARELSAAHGRLGQHRRAVQTLEAVRRRLPADRDVLFSLAAAYEQDRRYDRAERAFRELIAADASHAAALNHLGYMLAERGRKLPEAVELIKRALAVDAVNPSFLDSLGWAYFKLGQYDGAREPLEQAAAALPDASVVHDHLGDLYVRLQRHADAATAFERALAGDLDGIEVSAITKKRDRARSLAGRP